MKLLDTLESFCYKPQTIMSGSILLTEGESPCPTYVLINGAVKVTTGGVEIGIFKNAGDTFGEMAAILEGPVSATVETVEDSEMYVINNFSEFLSKNPSICVDLLKNSYHRLAQMNKGVNEMLKLIR
ncbi:MAG: cyclic nucleotide-binding domain-containing protein [Lentisphaeraceae bacterium]|nr:cyclic nucleotide-binding domain-containing protein [Lentisphaeraceae bacterium]